MMMMAKSVGFLKGTTSHKRRMWSKRDKEKTHPHQHLPWQGNKEHMIIPEQIAMRDHKLTQKTTCELHWAYSGAWNKCRFWGLRVWFRSVSRTEKFYGITWQWTSYWKFSRKDCTLCRTSQACRDCLDAVEESLHSTSGCCWSARTTPVWRNSTAYHRMVALDISLWPDCIGTGSLLESTTSIVVERLFSILLWVFGYKLQYQRPGYNLPQER